MTNFLCTAMPGIDFDAYYLIMELVTKVYKEKKPSWDWRDMNIWSLELLSLSFFSFFLSLSFFYFDIRDGS